MRRLVYFVFLIVSVLSLTAQTTPTAGTSAPASNNAAAEPKKSPFDFTFGPQKDGNFGTTLKGSKYYSLSGIDANSPASTRRLLMSPFFGVVVDAGWTSAANAANNASFSVRPSLGLSKIKGAPGELPSTKGAFLHAYFDVRERYGNFRQKDSALLRISQTMAGVGAELRGVWIDDWLKLSKKTGKIDEAPRFSVTYYTVHGTSVDKAALPDAIKANVVQAALKSDFTLPVQCTKKIVHNTGGDDIFPDGVAISCPWTFSSSLLGTHPTTGSSKKNEFMYDLALSFETGGSLKPVLQLRSGKEHGLVYDRQIILGILMKLFQ